MRVRGLLVAFLIFCLGFLNACSEKAVQAKDPRQLTYDEILGTGLANKCPEISEYTRGSIPISPDKPLQVVDMCLEPQEFFVKEEGTKRQEGEFVKGKLLTRQTTSLTEMRGTLTVDENGVLTLTEEDGIDFQLVTVQLPGGEQVPFMFTIKKLVAQSEPGFTAVNTSADFTGKFKVPPYRGASFLDPRARGLSSGYDSAVGLPAAADKEEYMRGNIKLAEVREGQISLKITKVDGETGEIGGVFESEQPSSTDLGAEEPKDVKIRGVFYARLEPQV
ncbi:MAG: photosystem II manganese-stabilizing polypeptide [Geminocystis sp.]|nr:photosystem II manganese-stabilizing polypeptide [Geminocystis sp.]MCS7148679.1 photosystem II manganese-stabilizing polypeptide [Geminocystis sp.]MCX8078209.1 photosystem II manganese-stabilizing polypeptide [Geminocystis sp.]MDW8115095.1 photosystem II manganese-stabilizing polypeptide [Geminocystis sp.]MDW8464361.1 photosystem II manganese-stabilizing polypeptide [Geminocystis sp.]